MKEFNFTTFPELTTNRLTLRQLKPDDVKAIYNLRSSKEINRLITRKTPKNLNDASEFITMIHKGFQNQKNVFWALILKETQQLIGTIVFHRISIDTNYAEIGYELNPTFHKKGFMNEAMSAVLDFGIYKMKFTVIEAFTHKNNSRSISLLKKHQFIFQSKRREEGFENNRIFKLKN